MKSIKKIGNKHVANSSNIQDNGIAIIMPAYNAANEIFRALSKVEESLENFTKNYEIIVVNDGSEDETDQIVRAYLNSNPKVKLISYLENMGKGFALKLGFSKVSKGSVIFLDSDLDIDTKYIEYYNKILKKCDMVIASRRHPKSDYRAPFMRKFLSTTFNVLVKLFVGIRYSDTQAGLKAFRKDALKEIMIMGTVKRHAFDVELLALASLLKLKVIESPVKISHSARFDFNSIISMFIDLLGIIYRLRILKWYQKNLRNKNANYKPIIPI